MAMRLALQVKTSMEVEGLELAKWFYSNFHCLEEQPVFLRTKSLLFKKFQKYLNRHIGRMEENKLRGIICLRDRFGHHTGGRVHLVAGLEGPIIEALQPQIIEPPIHYRKFSEYLIQAVEIASETTRPASGRIHFHPFWCQQEFVRPIDIINLVKISHLQNELQNIAEVDIFKFNFRLPIDQSFWQANVRPEQINQLFGKVPNNAVAK